MNALEGGCLCGAVRFSVDDAFRYALNCHCSQCRRATGAAFKPFAGIERAKLRVVSGEDELLICPSCGYAANLDGIVDYRCYAEGLRRSEVPADWVALSSDSYDETVPFSSHLGARRKSKSWWI